MNYIRKFLFSFSVILVNCIFLIGPFYILFCFVLFYLFYFLTSACLVGSFAPGQGFDEVLYGLDAIQTDVTETNQPTGRLYSSNL